MGQRLLQVRAGDRDASNAQEAEPVQDGLASTHATIFVTLKY